ncbi:MAG: hypothetical protein U0264_15225 [Candidatus Kapaibacterium sp.]
MESFTIKGESNFITLTFIEVFGFPETTCHWGGYDLRSEIEIKSSGFYVKSVLFTSTGEIYQFFQLLKSSNEKLRGAATFVSYEGNLDFIVEYDNRGHVNIKGSFSEQNLFENELKFEFISDQTYIHSSLKELSLLADKYGDMKGIIK